MYRIHDSKIGSLFNVLISSIILILTLILLNNCGGGSGGGGSSVSTGKFIDSTVQGIDYQSLSYQGITDSEGNFNYKSGEVTTFAIGDVILGETIGGSTITPFDLVPGATDESDPAVINICRFLQSLDVDGDPTNGIEITPEIAAELYGQSINFYLSIDDFNDTIEDLFDVLNAKDVFSANKPRQLISAEEAQSHFMEFLGTNDNDSSTTPTST